MYAFLLFCHFLPCQNDPKSDKKTKYVYIISYVCGKAVLEMGKTSCHPAGFP